jgi:excisionase family DNA binding protein
MRHAEVVPVVASSSSDPRTPAPTRPPEQLLAATPAAVQLLTIEEVAQRCHVSNKTVRRAIDRGELRASQLAARGAWVRPVRRLRGVAGSARQPASPFCQRSRKRPRTDPVPRRRPAGSAIRTVARRAARDHKGDGPVDRVPGGRDDQVMTDRPRPIPGVEIRAGRHRDGTVYYRYGVRWKDPRTGRRLREEFETAEQALDFKAQLRTLRRRGRVEDVDRGRELVADFATRWIADWAAANLAHRHAARLRLRLQPPPADARRPPAAAPRHAGGR